MQQATRGFLVAMIMVGGSGLSGCSGSLFAFPNQKASPTPTVLPTSVDPAMYAQDVAKRKVAAPGLNTCGLGLFNALASASATTNLALSPMSLARALLMAYDGARGSTRAALANGLGMPDQTSETLSDWQDASAPSLKRDGVTVTVADSVWSDSSLPVLPSFTSDLQSRFGAVTGSYSGSSDGTAKIRSWIRSATQGMLDGTGYSMPRGTLLTLVDALYFKGNWATAFDAGVTTQQPFNPASGSAHDVAMMHNTANFSYIATASYEAITLPYQDSPYSMHVILPPTGNSIPPLDSGLLATLLAGGPSTYGSIALPRFSLVVNSDLTAALEAGPMAPAFSDTADFSGMSTAFLRIGNVQQQVKVSVDEAGTTAAAATEVGMAGRAARMPEFNMVVDRPFYFVIRDDDTGVIMFVGRVADVS